MDKARTVRNPMKEKTKVNVTVEKLEPVSAEVSKRSPISDEELHSIAPSSELQRTSYVYGQAFNLYQKVFKVVGQKMELTIPQSLGPTELSKLLPLEPQSITAVLDRLEERKLVRRRRSPSDRRAIKVLLTGDGHELLRIRIPAMKCLLECTVGMLSSEERRSLETISRKLSEAAVNLLGANTEHLDEMIELFTKRIAQLER